MLELPVKSSFSLCEYRDEKVTTGKHAQDAIQPSEYPAKTTSVQLNEGLSEPEGDGFTQSTNPEHFQQNNENASSVLTVEFKRARHHWLQRFYGVLVAIGPSAKELSEEFSNSVCN
jgi:hypothetical protein